MAEKKQIRINSLNAPQSGLRFKFAWNREYSSSTVEFRTFGDLALSIGNHRGFLAVFDQM